MEGNLAIEIDANGEEASINLVGIIDEDSSFGELEALSNTKMKIDWSNVKGINSCGIREWTNFLKTLNPQIQVRYTNCPIHIIEQVNMIIDFVKKGATVETFYTPYFCDDCDEERSILVNVKEIVNGKAPTKTCQECNGELEFDAMEEQFFNFLK